MKMCLRYEHFSSDQSYIIQVERNILHRDVVKSCRRIRGLTGRCAVYVNPEDGGITVLRNVDIQPPNHTASQTRGTRLLSSPIPLIQEFFQYNTY
jgi:hypothetical protein